MSADRLLGALRRRNLGQHFFVFCRHARKVHHLAEPDDVRPAHGLLDIMGLDAGAGRLEPRRRGHAAWHLNVDVDGHRRGFVVHQADARQPEDIGDLVRIDEHRRRPVRDHGATEFGDRHHAALDVHMRVAEARDQVASFRIDDRRVRTDGVAEARSNRRDPPADNGDVRARHDLSRMDAEPARVLKERVRRRASHRHVDEQ